MFGKRIGNSIYVELCGETYISNKLSSEDANFIMESLQTLQSEDEHLDNDLVKKIISMFKVPEEFEKEKNNIINFKNITELAKINSDMFEFKEESLYLKGIPLSIPRVLAERISSSKIEDATPLLNFWKNLALNPCAHSREQSYNFLNSYKFEITELGFLIAYRSVELHPDTHKELFKYVLSLINDVKRWKRPLSYYHVFEYNENGIIKFTKYDEQAGKKTKFNTKNMFFKNLASKYTDVKYIGCLNTLQQFTWVTFTDKYTRQMRIYLGDVVKLDRNLCEHNPNESCAKGLHVGTPDFVKGSNKGFGEFSIAVLINPMDIVSVPNYDFEKMRVCQYYPVCLVDVNENGEFNKFEYREQELQFAKLINWNLRIMQQEAVYKELKQHKTIPDQISIETLRILNSDFTKQINQFISGKLKKI